MHWRMFSCERMPSSLYILITCKLFPFETDPALGSNRIISKRKEVVDDIVVGEGNNS
jgi:hypothetical protein